MVKNLVSVVIVNRNGMRWLDKCLRTVFNQSHRPIEVLVIDNASSDSSITIIKTQFPKVRLFTNNTNLGFAAANNQGVHFAKGSHILLLNTDCWMEKNLLKELLAHMESSQLDAIAPYEFSYDGLTKGNYSTVIDVFGHPVYASAEDYTESFFLTGACVLVSRQAYRESGGLDGDFFMYCEEVDWFWRLIMKNMKFAYAPNLKIYHAGASGSRRIRTDIFLWRNQNTLLMLLKNYRITSLLWVIPLYILQNLIEIIFFILILRPRIAWTYVQGWKFNIVNIRNTKMKRRKIQSERVVNDIEIIARMYRGSGKLWHLSYSLKKDTKF